MSQNTFSYPSKVKKFGIEQIHLKFIVAKYENEIPWQTEVKNETTCIAFIKSTLLPTLIKRATWPLVDSQQKHFFTEEKHLNLALALRNEHDMNTTEFDKLKLIHKNNGEKAALKFLCEIVNKKKFEGFSQWITFMQSKYPNDIAFQLLILRPIFESAGLGVRRSITAPSEDIVEWLHMRIEKQRITPKSNLSREYFIKSAFGSGLVIENGWQVIKKNSPARKLMAAAQGSGWCIRDSFFASSYLKSYDFYILRSNKKPVVALRVNPFGKKIVECVDPFNEYPQLHVADIFFFMESLGLNYSSAHFMNDVSALHLDHVDFTEQWWKQRLKYWPFIVDRVPKEYIDQKVLTEHSIIPSYIELFPIEEIEKKLNIKLTIDDLESILMIRPDLYDVIIPKRNNEDIQRLQSAAINACIEKIEDKSLTFKEIELLPDFVKTNESFKSHLISNMPKSLLKKMERVPKSYTERLNPTLLEAILPYSANETIEISITRAQQNLVLYEGSNFSDNIFNEDLRNNPNFAQIREQTWLKAILTYPTYYFALPEDLKKNGIYVPQKEIKDQALLEKWIKNVEEKPWILTSKTGVPKSVRYHEKLLSAYIAGWIPILFKNPSRLWKAHKNGYGSRAYLSYPALKNKFILNALIDGFMFKPNEFNESSGRMKSMPNYLMAALIAGQRSGMLHSYSHLPEPKRDDLVNKNEDPIDFYNNEFLKGNRTLLIDAYVGLDATNILKLDTTPPTSFFVLPKTTTKKKSGPTAITKGSLLEIRYNGRKMLISIDVDKKGYVTFTSNQMETKLLKNTRVGTSFKIGANTIELIDILG